MINKNTNKLALMDWSILNDIRTKQGAMSDGTFSGLYSFMIHKTFIYVVDLSFDRLIYHVLLIDYLSDCLID